MVFVWNELNLYFFLRLNKIDQLNHDHEHYFTSKWESPAPQLLPILQKETTEAQDLNDIKKLFEDWSEKVNLDSGKSQITELYKKVIMIRVLLYEPCIK